MQNYAGCTSWSGTRWLDGSCENGRRPSRENDHDNKCKDTANCHFMAKTLLGAVIAGKHISTESCVLELGHYCLSANGNVMAWRGGPMEIHAVHEQESDN